MDADRFDALTKSLRVRLSRRAAIGPIAGMAALLGLTHPEAALARCGTKNPCPVCKTCKNGECKPQKNGKLCANSNECRGCCGDKECPACAECTSGFDSNGSGGYRCRKKEKPFCGIDPACTAYVCNKTTNDWTCKYTCCDDLAGE